MFAATPFSIGRGLPSLTMATRGAVESSSSSTSRGGSPALLEPGSAAWSPGSSRDTSPAPPELLSVSQAGETGDVRGSPRLSRRALKELKSVEEEERENGDDPCLYNPWTFWFEK